MKNHPIQKNEDDDKKPAAAAPPRKYTNRDVVYGRGSATRDLPGNQGYREVIDPFMKKYHDAKDDKAKKAVLTEAWQVLKTQKFRFWTEDGEEVLHYSQVLLKIRTRWTTQKFNLEIKQISEKDENRQISSLALDIMKEIDKLEKNNEGLSIEELVSLLDEKTSLLFRAARALDRQDQKNAASAKKKKVRKAKKKTGTKKTAADGAPPAKKRKVAAQVAAPVPTVVPTAIKHGSMDTAGGTLADQDQKTLDTFKTTPATAAAAKAAGFPQSNEQNAHCDSYSFTAVPDQQNSTSKDEMANNFFNLEQGEMSATAPPRATVSPDSTASTATATAPTKNFQGKPPPFCIGPIPTRVSTSPKVCTTGMAFTQEHRKPADFSSSTTRAGSAAAPEATFATEGTAFTQNRPSSNMDTAVGVFPPSPSSSIFSLALLSPTRKSLWNDDGTVRINYDMSILDDHHFLGKEWNADS